MFMVLKINNKMLSKEEIFTELEEVEPKIKEIIKNALDNNGIVYGAKKKKKIKAVYILNEKKNDNKKILKLSKVISSLNIDEKMLKDLDELLKDEMKEKVIFDEEYNEIEWNDEVITSNKIQVGKYNVPLGILFFILGISFSVIFDNFLFLSLGIVLAVVTGVIIKPKNK